MKKIILIITLSLLGQISYTASMGYWLDKVLILLRVSNLENLLIKAIREKRDLTPLLKSVTHANFRDKGDYTLLHLAVYYNNLKAANKLIELGANINAQNIWSGKAPLHIALEKRYSDMIKALLGSGTYVNIIDHRGNTPLHIAARKANTDIVQLLIDSGANVNLQNDFGYTPLHKALEKNNLDIAKILIKKGADVNAQNELKRTPLHYAVRHKYLYLIKYLIDNGANPSIQDILGKTALNIAEEEYNENTEIYNFIKDSIIEFQPNPLFQKDISCLFNLYN